MSWTKSVSREVGLYITAALVVGGLVWCAARLFGSEIPQANRDMVVSITTFLVAKAGTIVDYFFGSSKGSADKNEALVPKAPQP